MNGLHKLLPAYVALVAASAQPGAPSPRGVLEDHFEPLAIATDTRVLVIATPFQTSRLRLRVPWRMAVVTTPCPDCSHTPAPPLPDRLPLDDLVSTACLGPRVGKAEHVEAPRAPCRGLSAWWPLERHERRLFGMNGQAEAGKPFRQDVHHPAGVGFQCAAEDAIIRKTREKALALHPGLHVFDTPCVQDSMQAYL